MIDYMYSIKWQQKAKNQRNPSLSSMCRWKAYSQKICLWLEGWDFHRMLKVKKKSSVDDDRKTNDPSTQSVFQRYQSGIQRNSCVNSSIVLLCVCVCHVTNSQLEKVQNHSTHKPQTMAIHSRPTNGNK